MLRVREGDRQAYAELFSRHGDRVWTYLVRKTGDREGAHDLFQDVFLKVWRLAGTFRAGQRFRPWLYRVATNTARDRYRKLGRRVETADVELERLHGRMSSPIAAIDLERALGQLPDHLREAFILGAMEGMDHREMAVALEVSPANARARLSRARKQLRDLLLAGESS